MHVDGGAVTFAKGTLVTNNQATGATEDGTWLLRWAGPWYTFRSNLLAMIITDFRVRRCRFRRQRQRHVCRSHSVREQRLRFVPSATAGQCSDTVSFRVILIIL